MTEMLDVYDANKKHIGTADRNVVHTFGLWHNTVHCWLVVMIDGTPHMVFQRRAHNLSANAGKLYTTASGHVSAGETLETAFNREIAQEIGIDVTSLTPKHLSAGPWVADIKRNDGSLFVDRVFANVYYSVYNGNMKDFRFTDGEVAGIVAIDLDRVIEFFNGVTTSVSALEFDGEKIIDVTLTPADFVCNDGENLRDKFGSIANKIKMDF